jgi:hypothetical protein
MFPNGELPRNHDHILVDVQRCPHRLMLAHHRISVRFAAGLLRCTPCFDPERNASIVGKPLPSPRALAPDVQRAVLVHRPVDGSEAAMRRGKSAAGDRERIVLQLGDDARWVHLRADRYLMCCFFFAALQGFCFFSGVAGSFLCLLFFSFFFPLFSNCSFGGFLATLVGPGQFWGIVGGFVQSTALRASSRRDRLEFAREAHRASQAACFDRVFVVSVSFKSCHHDGDGVAFIAGGQPTFCALAPSLIRAIQADRPHGFIGLWVDLGFDRLLAGVFAARLDGPEDGRRGVRCGRECESNGSDARSSGQP